jgi:hypothetical protein
LKPTALEKIPFLKTFLALSATALKDFFSVVGYSVKKSLAL